MSEVQAVEPALAVEGLGHPPEDLARDHAGIASGAHQRPETDGRGDPVGRLAGDAFRFLEGRPRRGQHVRARVAVGHRVDVQGVDLIDVRFEVGDRRPEGVEQSGAITGPSGHQATSVPSSARSCAPTGALGSPTGDTRASPTGDTRSPPMWMVSLRTSRPRASWMP